MDMGNYSFYLVYIFHSPDRYIMYREEVITNFDQRVGFEGCYCNYLAICHYFLNKKPPVMNNIIYHSYFEILNFSTRSIPVQ